MALNTFELLTLLKCSYKFIILYSIKLGTGERLSAIFHFFHFQCIAGWWKSEFEQLCKPTYHGEGRAGHAPYFSEIALYDNN